jgi:hypothetical protein
MSKVRFGDEELQLIFLNYPQLEILFLQLNMETLTDSGFTGIAPNSIKRMIYRRDMAVHDPEFEISGHSFGHLKGTWDQYYN